MTKRTGLGNRLYIDGYDVSGDVGAVNTLATPRDIRPITGIDKFAIERQLLKADGSIDFATWFNSATDKLHDVLSTLPTTNRQAIFALSITRGDPAFALEAKQINYDWSRGDDGGLGGTTNLQAASGNAPAWGESIVPKENLASAGAYTGHIDVGGVQTTDGVVAWLQIISLGSGTPVITLEDSSDTTDGDDGAWSTIDTFTIDSARTTERRVVAGNIEKALRIEASGTFTNLVVVAMVRRGTAEDD